MATRKICIKWFDKISLKNIGVKYYFFAAEDKSIFTSGLAAHAQSLHAHSVHAHAAHVQIARNPDAYVLQAVYSIITRFYVI